MNSHNTRIHPPTTQAAPSPEPYSFAGPTDSPKGASYQATQNGFKASVPTSSWLMAVVFGVISASLGYVLSQGTQAQEGAPASFIAFMGTLLAITSTIFLFFVLGREGIEVKGNRLFLRKTVFGLGLRKSMNLPKIVRAQVRKRAGMRGLGRIQLGSVRDQILELEDDAYIRKMGSNLDEKHLYYIRYLIIEAVKASRQPLK